MGRAHDDRDATMFTELRTPALTLTPISPTARFRRRPNVLVRDLDGEAVLLDLDSGRYFGLNATGVRIFELVDGDRSVEEVRLLLAREFTAPSEAIAADLYELVAALEVEGLLLRLE